MSNTKLAIQYLKFWLAAKRKKGHGIHSPFFFDLVSHVFYKKKNKTDYKPIEELRKQLLKSNEEIEIRDLGAGSRTTSSQMRKISDIAQHSLKPKKQAQLLNRLIQYIEPSNILELGTSLGITTSYLAKASPKAKVITIEGCPEITKRAQQNLTSLNVDNVELVCDNLNNSLEKVVTRIETIDFAFFDGNHTKQATLKYFDQCLKKANNNSIFCFDDIYLNDGMQEAWQEIIAHKNVTASLDIFFMGFVFFRKELSHEHFKLRF